MAYTYLLYHIIIRPKESKPVIKTDHEKKLYSYIWGICKEKKCVLHRINGMEDHLHMLVEIHPSISVSDFVRMVKHYIANQKVHHKTVSFKDEYERLLREFGIEPDQWMLTD